MGLYTKKSERRKRREGSAIKAISRLLSFFFVRFLVSCKVSSQEQENWFTGKCSEMLRSEKRCDVLFLWKIVVLQKNFIKCCSLTFFAVLGCSEAPNVPLALVLKWIQYLKNLHICQGDICQFPNNFRFSRFHVHFIACYLTDSWHSCFIFPLRQYAR